MLHEHVERRNFHNKIFLKHCMFYILFPILYHPRSNRICICHQQINRLFTVVCHQQIDRIFFIDSRLSQANTEYLLLTVVCHQPLTVSIHDSTVLVNEETIWYSTVYILIADLYQHFSTVTTAWNTTDSVKWVLRICFVSFSIFHILINGNKTSF